MSPMVDPQTANREKKIPPKMNFDVRGYIVGLVALKALLPCYGITHAVYKLSTVCILKRNPKEPGIAGVLKWYKIVRTSCTL